MRRQTEGLNNLQILSIYIDFTLMPARFFVQARVLWSTFELCYQTCAEAPCWCGFITSQKPTGATQLLIRTDSRTDKFGQDLLLPSPWPMWRHVKKTTLKRYLLIILTRWLSEPCVGCSCQFSSSPQTSQNVTPPAFFGFSLLSYPPLLPRLCQTPCTNTCTCRHVRTAKILLGIWGICLSSFLFGENTEVPLIPNRALHSPKLHFSSAHCASNTENIVYSKWGELTLKSEFKYV